MDNLSNFRRRYLTLIFNFCSSLPRLSCVQALYRTISSYVIDSLSHFHRPMLNEKHYLRTVFGGTWAELYQIWDHQHHSGICFRFQISCCISKRGWFKGEWCRKLRVNFASIDPVKLGEGGGPGEKNNLHQRLNLWYTFHGWPVRGQGEPSSSKKRKFIGKP